MTISQTQTADAERLEREESLAPGRAAGGAPAAKDSRDYQRIREVLAKANYTDQGVTAALGIENLSRLREKKLPVLLRRTAGGTPLETLVRLFVLGQPADLEAARRAIAPMTLEEWREIGLIGVTG
ncbi:MAG: DUF7059 domain-containing protein, partial [Candidatus Acidiferrales bacterium]